MNPQLNTANPDGGHQQQQQALASARLAQSVERETLNLKVAGSTPASGSIPDASSSEGTSELIFFGGFFRNTHLRAARLCVWSADMQTVPLPVQEKQGLAGGLLIDTSLRSGSPQPAGAF